MKAWQIISFIFIGISVVEYLVILALRNKMGDQITIKKQVQKNRKSPNNSQEYQANQENTPEKKDRKRIINLFKKRKNGKS